METDVILVISFNFCVVYFVYTTIYLSILLWTIKWLSIFFYIISNAIITNILNK